MSICLNMIVKNEAENIIPTLENLCSHFKFAYWVISDTGSTDKTKELITQFFTKKKIKGELYDDKWEDFGHNRTRALEEAYNKTDYLLIFDADDKIDGTIVLPKLVADKYMFVFGTQVKYLRPLLITNRKQWKFVGVLHEYLELKEPGKQSMETIRGKYHVVSGRTGDRNKNVNKYYDDAMILMKAYFKEMGRDKQLAARYAFYCAQSFRDSGNHVDDSIEWYKKVLDLNNWNQEKYYSCIELGKLLFHQKKSEEGLFYFLKSVEYDHERVEGISMAMNYYRHTNMHLLVNLLYNKFKNYQAREGKLFQYNDIYTHLELDYHNSISSFFIDKESGAESCKKILLQDTKYTHTTLLMLKKYEEYISVDWLPIFYKCNDYLENHKNDDMKDIFEIWYILFNKVKSELTKINNTVVETIRNALNFNTTPTIFLSFLNTGGLDGFKNTIHSMMNTWKDIDKVDYWFCVDQQIKGDDRGVLRKKYKWLKYHFDGGDAMEIIRAKVKEVGPQYWIHIENGVFHTRMNYVRGMKNTQVKYNRNYAKTISDYSIKSYMKLTDEYITPEMTPRSDFAFSINDASATDLEIKFLNRIVCEIR